MAALYTYIIDMVSGESSSSRVYKISLAVVRFAGKEFEDATVRLFRTHCLTRLFTVEFHLLDDQCQRL